MLSINIEYTRQASYVDIIKSRWDTAVFCSNSPSSRRLFLWGKSNRAYERKISNLWKISMSYLGVTTVPPNGKFSATMYAQTGEMTIYAQTSLRAIIHECGHAQDYARGIRNVGFTSSDTWKQAVKRSTCRATNYGRDSGSIVEEYAEDMMIYTYNKFRGNRYLALNPACLKPELQALETYTRSLSG